MTWVPISTSSPPSAPESQPSLSGLGVEGEGVVEEEPVVVQAGLHDPDIVMARFDYAYDANAARTLEARGLDPSTELALIDANEAAIEAAGVTQHSYTAPGDDHGLFEFETFYDLEVDGVTLTDWLDALLSGQPLADVHCDDCEPP